MYLLRSVLLALASFLPAFLAAQIFDNFSDGNFDQNPAWVGDTANFSVNAAQELHLDAAVAGSSSIAVQGNIPTSATWDLRFRLGLSPSGSNLLRIYLLADQQNLALANGYFLEIGETGSADALRLYRQNGASVTLLGAGTPGLVAVNPDIHLFVTRSLAGLWTIEAASGTGALATELSATDATHPGGANKFMGFQCVYTVSNINRYFFDDIQIGLGAPDTDPPQLLSANANNEFQVTAVFNEPLGAVAPSNFSISGGIGQPLSATLQADGSQVLLVLASPLATGTYTLQSIGVPDVSGNVSATQSVDFQFIKTETAEEFDVLINEIMADPSPAQGLPEVEWFELFNRSNKTLDLANLRIADASGTQVQLPSYLLEPGAYVAITALINAASLGASTTGAVVGAPIGVTTLNNDGDILTLSNSTGETIDRVAYDLDWHSDLGKKDGGWSLERINPGLPCLGQDNWQSSLAADGGTPGLPNSGLSVTPDIEAPHLIQVQTESASSLLLFFSEGLDKASAEDPAAYHINPSRTVATAVQVANRREQVRLTLATPIQPATVYALTVDASLRDCSSNSAAATDTLYFGLAEQAAQHDVIVHEIMSKPSPSVGLPAVEWFELYNRSSKIIDLGTLRIQDLSSAPVTLPTYMLVPGAVVALTALNNAALLQASTTGVVLGAGFSSSLLNDDGDVIKLSNSSGEMIDYVPYNPGWHTTSGKEDGGWSLERINYDLPCLGGENWQSCPVLPGGTPGKANASYQATTDEQAPVLLWAYPESANSVMLTFFEGLDKPSMENIVSYEFIPSLNIQAATQQDNFVQVLLTLAEPMEDGVVYSVTVKQTLTDCSGNSADLTDTVQVGIPQKPEPQDIVINEVMYNPASGDARYIEFYNRSEKVFDWRRFFIGNYQNVVGTSEIVQRRLSVPGHYQVFSSNAPNVRERFQNIYYRNVMENNLPTLDDKEGRIRLYWALNGDTVELDELPYNDSWHNGLYSVGDRDGVALERIRINRPTDDPSNWTSASPYLTGAPGTPTLPNSQRLSETNPAEDMISLNPARLSPDDDGYEDFLDIQYHFPKAGYAASAGIFDSDGNRIKYLVRQDLLGTEGSLRWDGDSGEGLKARPGIHILFMEIFGPDGEVLTLRKTFVVVAKQ